MTIKQKRYEALVQVYHTELYRFAYWLCNDPTIAEDLVQETFLRAWRSLDALQDDKAVKPWLLTILRREKLKEIPPFLGQAFLLSVTKWTIPKINCLGNTFYGSMTTTLRARSLVVK